MNIALFGRHASPAEHIVFPEGLPDDKMAHYGYMKTGCIHWLKQMDESELELLESWCPEVRLYVEGFTPALIAFLIAWEVFYGGQAPVLWLMHYQPDGTYLEQRWKR